MQLQALLLAASTVIAADQIPLQAATDSLGQGARKTFIDPLPFDDSVEETIRQIQDAMPDGSLLGDVADDAWKSLMDKLNIFPSPKAPKHPTPDSEWDHVVRGADIQNRFTVNASGKKEREIDGHLENYNLRVKKVDPSALNVDTVKQYSGYLDSEEDDKHLFYCRSFFINKDTY